MHNVASLLNEAGCAMSDIVKITIYTTDRAHREPVYQVVGRWLKGVFPVWLGLLVSGRASPDWLMEIDLIAEKQSAVDQWLNEPFAASRMTLNRQVDADPIILQRERTIWGSVQDLATYSTQ